MSAMITMTAPNPFAALLGIQPVRLAKSTAALVVVQGRKITDVRQINAALLGYEADDSLAGPEVLRLRREVERAKWRARYQRDRLCPEKMAKRQAWKERNREKVAAFKRAYDQANRERLRELQAVWARKHYYANAEACRAKQRAYYAANRARILARLQAQRDAAKAAKAAKLVSTQPCA